MKPSNDKITAKVAESLSANLDRVEATGGQSWEFTFPSPHRSRGRALLADGWLYFRVAADLPALIFPESSHFHLLAWNYSFPAGVKLVLEEDGGITFGVEIPVEPASDPGPAVKAVSLGLTKAVTMVAKGESEAKNSSALNGQATDAMASKVTKLCEESGWQTSRRDNGEVAITLEVIEDFCQARAIACSNDEIRLQVDLSAMDAQSVPANCQRAAAMLLQRAGSRMNMVRGTARSNGKVTLGVESVIVGTVSQETLHHSMSALSTFCNATRKEVMVLQEDEAIAGAYLELYDVSVKKG